MNITLSGKHVHHSLKIAGPLGVTVLLTSSQINLPVRIALWALLVVASFAGVLACLHANRAVLCEYCHRLPATKRQTVHARAWAAYGRYGWILVSTLVLSWLTSIAVWGTIGDHPHAWPNRVFLATIAAAAATYLSAKRFSDVNYDLPRPRPLRRLLRGHTMLVHKSRSLFAPLMLLNVLTIPLPEHGPWLLVSLGVLLLTGLVAYLSSRHHGELCEHCVIEFRTDAPEYAAEHRGRFVVAHRQDRLLPLYIVASLSSHFMPLWWRVGTIALTSAVAVAAMYITAFHDSYRPWCPLCRRDDGGEGRGVPDPDPSQGKPLPV